MVNFLLRGCLSSLPFSIIPLSLTLLGIIFFCRYKNKKTIEENIRQNGIHAVAHVIKCYKSLVTKTVIYAYEHQGKTYTQMQYISTEAFENLKDLSEISVYYLIENPERSTLVESDIYYLDYQIASICFILAFIYFLYIILSSIVIIILIQGHIFNH